MDRLLAKRRELIDERERFVGMPTLDYDPIMEDLTDKIVEIETSMVQTCEGCGGEIIPDQIEHLNYEPENGLCNQELLSCKDHQLSQLEARVVELESQLGIAFEIMTVKQIQENKHLFQHYIKIDDSATNQITEKSR